MKIILCTDDNWGLSFNNRRQSKDKAVREKILEITKGCRLWMSEYSYRQFEENPSNVSTDENFIDKAGNDDFCFIENLPVNPKNADKLYIFFWNRSYPSDLKLNFNPESNGFHLESVSDFKGNSHDKITLKIYSQNQKTKK